MLRSIELAWSVPLKGGNSSGYAATPALQRPEWRNRCRHITMTRVPTFTRS
ncbi:hypothetical protein AGR3A_Cc420026 [Agrobacterium tomkonis CFBP 6623]|uniref:Uncharacterized protein n=1 Tax=Agrobacterium tomkonis CFBP 6623 TaxID=1183432 RepID=A0A1S7Q7E6_9HYPH|nr:hypothetical protein AGR3A_Cc420026 [Agrobacterium tomkonis CFBP 6623]